MNPASPKKLSPQKLRKPPAWLEAANKSFQQGPLASLSDKEIGQRCEVIAAKAAKNRQPQTSAR